MDFKALRAAYAESAAYDPYGADTDNRKAMTGQIRKVLTEHPEEFDPRKYLKPAMEAMAKLCKQRLQEFNTAGQASKIKKVLTTAEMAKRYTKGELDPKVA